MKLKFDPNQQYQLDAIDAVIDVFAGQRKGIVAQPSRQQKMSGVILLV